MEAKKRVQDMEVNMFNSNHFNDWKRKMEEKDEEERLN
jgi:hypothetical protein